MPTTRLTRLDLEIPQRSTYKFVVTVVGGPPSLVGYVGHLQMRESVLDALPSVDLGAEAITVNDTTRQVTVVIPAEATEVVDWEVGVYDLYLEGTEPWRLVQGVVKINQSVTRED